ncbi:MAG: NUDIX domain-containing protein [bacterium]
MPGGGILPNETALECVEREIQEEIGLQNIQ